MTCFWKGFVEILNKERLDYGHSKKNIRKNIGSGNHLIMYFKNNNTKTTGNKTNGEFVSDIVIDKNYENVTKFKAKGIDKGYFCGYNDPFINLFVKLFRINIMIRQGGEQIFYENDQNKLTYICSADNGHFSITKRATTHF
jgi:hypothetical protein